MAKKNRGLFDLQVDFFLPLWRRYALVAVCACWSVLEFATAAPFWGIIFGGLGAIAVWQLFFDGWPESAATESAPSHDAATHAAAAEPDRQEAVDTNS